WLELASLAAPLPFARRVLRLPGAPLTIGVSAVALTKFGSALSEPPFSALRSVLLICIVSPHFVLSVKADVQVSRLVCCRHFHEFHSSRHGSSAAWSSLLVPLP